MRNLKKLIFGCMLLSGFVCSTQLSFAGNIPFDKDKWNSLDNRMPSELMSPEASIDGNAVTIHFIDGLTDLTVCIADLHGNIIYNDVISGESGSTYTLPVDLEMNKTYQIQLVHKAGYLYGTFIAE